jgi:asparagine synthase (glutamine-hydrolysing)
MCGIAGFLDPASTVEAREQAVLRMCQAMEHRGPDDSGMASAGPATIGMRRLAIFDPSNGHQPMTTPDRRYTLVFNGAIYNFRSLQHELESAGWTFRTRCDTEVLLAALAQWGEGALARLRGMFAFALWDSKEESLLLARDPFGIKPLYFVHKAERLVFASEISALLASGASEGSIDPDSVIEYLAWLAVPAPSTIYEGICSLQPGECLKMRGGAVSIRTWWSFGSIPAAASPCASRAEFVKALRSHLDDTIRAHLLADVPVGAFLSGGLDSAVVAGLMSRASSDPLKTFTIGFEENNFSEADEAEATARHFGTIHHTRILTGDEVARGLDGFLSACDQPTGDGINTYYISQTARNGGVKVALSGLGGDELFGGYPSFRMLPILAKRLPLWRRIPRPLRLLAISWLRTGKTRARKLSDFLAYATDAHEVGALQRRVFSESSSMSVLAPDLAMRAKARTPFHPRLEAMRTDLGWHDSFSLVSAWELRTYMADVLLRDSDVMSMRHSIELRVPFVDRPLIEWLWGQSDAFKEDERRPKSALLEAVSDILPPGLVERRKRGFTFPFPIWMRSDLRPFIEDTLSPAGIGKSGYFSAGPILALWRAFVSGRNNVDWSRIWSLVVLIDFINCRRGAMRPLNSIQDRRA